MRSRGEQRIGIFTSHADLSDLSGFGVKSVAVAVAPLDDSLSMSLSSSSSSSSLASFPSYSLSRKKKKILRSLSCMAVASLASALPFCFLTAATALDVDFSDDVMMQLSIGEFQIELAPTPEPLTNVDTILGRSIESVVQREMERVFADSFEYMYVAGLSQVDVKTPSTRQLNQTVTSAFYNGGVVAFDSQPSIDIYAVLQSSIDSYLRDELVAHGESWAFIERVTFVSEKNIPTDATTLSPTGTRSDEPTSNTMSPPTGDVSAIEGNGASTTLESEELDMPHIVASGFGVAFIVIGAVLFLKGSKRQVHVRDTTTNTFSLEEAESPSNETKNPSPNELAMATGLYLEHQGDGAANAYVFEDTEDDDDEDRSVMAQYSNGEWLDSTSGGQSVTSSDFTLATTDDGTYSALAENAIGRQSPHAQLHPETSSRVAVMGFASAETFERDRLVTLHKDMLQSDWGGLSTPGHVSYTTPRSTSSSSTVSFEQAYQDGDGPGEEICLMSPSRKPRRRKHADDDDDDDDNLLA